MTVTEERLTRLHRRVRVLQRRRMKRSLAAWGGTSALLLAQLILLTGWYGGPVSTIEYSGMTGASLLHESTGGYVLVGVLAFFLGVVITVAIHRYRNRQERNGDWEPPKEDQGRAD